jgi:PAS domain S-box-containing protein
MAEASDSIVLKEKISELERRLNTYRRLIDNNPDLIYRTDLEGRITYISPSVYRLSGYTVEEAIGMKMAEEVYLAPEERRAFLEELQEKGSIVDFRARLRRKDGGVWWASTNAHFFHDDHGNIAGVEGVTRDITTLKAAEDLLGYEARFHRVIGEIASSFINMPPRQIDQGVNHALALIGEFVGADRSHIFSFDRPSGMLTNTHEWCRPGIAPQIDRLKEVPKEVFEWFRKPLSQLCYVHVPSVADLPEAAGVTKAELEREGIKSILLVPLVSEGQYAGSIGFDFVTRERNCTENEILLLEMAGATIANVLDRKRAEEALRKSEERMHAIFEATPDPLVVYDTQGHPLYVNPAFLDVFGWRIDELRGRPIPFVPPDQKERTAGKIREIYKSGKPVRFLTNRLTKSSETVEVIVSAAIINGPEGLPDGMVVNLTDISGQRNLEAQLQQAQKMESVGRLAGGVAHDFNNMLGVILGHTELALLKTRLESPLFADLNQIKNAAKRSADLTRQLLGFARWQAAAPKVIDLNDVIPGMLAMLRRLIGENINLQWMPGPNLPPVKIDPGQIDQILANLCVNARDAIENFGTITIFTSSILLDEAYCTEHEGAFPGQYVMLTVSDTGCGMDTNTLEKAFEPFFTTKEVGRGTGLGLATVYGIVKQNNGFISAKSRPGQGTSITVYLPITIAELTPEKKPDAGMIAKGTETVLVVEDETAFLNLCKIVLSDYGYTVLAAYTPKEAIELAGRSKGQIHLLLTDVVMPDMNGEELRGRIEQLSPGIKTLYMSGHAADVFAHQDGRETAFRFIQKPFSPNALAGKVREILDEGPKKMKE